MLCDEAIYTQFQQGVTVYSEGPWRAEAVPIATAATPAWTWGAAAKSETGFVALSLLTGSGGPQPYSHDVITTNTEQPRGTVGIQAGRSGPGVAWDGSRVAWSNGNSSTSYGVVYRNPASGAAASTVNSANMVGAESVPALSPDGRYAYFYNEGRVVVFNLQFGFESTSMAKNSWQSVAMGGYPGLAAAPDGLAVFMVAREIVSNVVTGPWKLVKLDSSGAVLRYDDVGIPAESVMPGYTIAVSPDSGKVLVADWALNYLRCFNVSSMTERWAVPLMKGMADFSLDGQRVYAIEIGGNSIKTFDAGTGELISTTAQSGSNTRSITVARNVRHFYAQGLVCDAFGGEMMTRNAFRSPEPGTTYQLPTGTEVYYIGANKAAREKRKTMPGLVNARLYHRNGFNGAMVGMIARETETGEWVLYHSRDFGWTWELRRVVFDDSFVYADVCTTADGIEVAAGVKRIATSTTTTFELWTKYSSNGTSWSDPVKVTGSASNGPVTIRQKVECNSSLLVMFQGLARWQSKNFGRNWTQT